MWFQWINFYVNAFQYNYIQCIIYCFIKIIIIYFNIFVAVMFVLGSRFGLNDIKLCYVIAFVLRSGYDLCKLLASTIIILHSLKHLILLFYWLLLCYAVATFSVNYLQVLSLFNILLNIWFCYFIGCFCVTQWLRPL